MNRRERRATAARGRRSTDAPAQSAPAPPSHRAATLDATDDRRFRDAIGRARAAQTKATGELLDQGKTPQEVVRACAGAHVHAQTLAQPLVDREHRIACKEGCAWCCHLRVSSTPLEVLGIAEWLRSELSENELAEVRERACALADETAGMTSTERPPWPCPLLADNRCRAYQARPLTCRGWHSFDVSPCRAYVEGRGDAAVEVDTRVITLFQAILGGVEDAARERSRDGETVDFAVALSVALEMPDAIARWSNGERIFDRAHTPSHEPSPGQRLIVVA